MKLTRTAVRSAVAALASMVFVGGLALPARADTGPGTNPDVMIENNIGETAESIEDTAKYIAIGTQPPCSPTMTTEFWVTQSAGMWVEHYAVTAALPYGCAGGVTAEAAIYDTTRYPTPTHRQDFDSDTGVDYARAEVRVSVPASRLVGEVSIEGMVARGSAVSRCHYAEYAAAAPSQNDPPHYVRTLESTSCA